MICVAVALFVIAIYAGWTWVSQSRKASEAEYSRRLMREAIGQQPVTNSGGQQGEMEAMARDMIAAIPEINRRYRERIAAADLSELPNLFAATSFRDADEMNKMRSQLQTVLDLDESQENELYDWLSDARKKVQASSWSEVEKQAFLAGMERGQGKMMAARQEMIAAERDWIHAAQSVYDYALENREDIQVQGSQLIIPPAEIRAEFNLREQNAQEKRKVFDQAKDSLTAMQNQSLDRIGLTPEDIRKMRQGQ